MRLSPSPGATPSRASFVVTRSHLSTVCFSLRAGKIAETAQVERRKTAAQDVQTRPWLRRTFLMGLSRSSVATPSRARSSLAAT